MNLKVNNFKIEYMCRIFNLIFFCVANVLKLKPYDSQTKINRINEFLFSFITDSVIIALSQHVMSIGTRTRFLNTKTLWRKSVICIITTELVPLGHPVTISIVIFMHLILFTQKRSVHGHRTILKQTKNCMPSTLW